MTPTNEQVELKEVQALATEIENCMGAIGDKIDRPFTLAEYLHNAGYRRPQPTDGKLELNRGNLMQLMWDLRLPKSAIGKVNLADAILAKFSQPQSAPTKEQVRQAILNMSQEDLESIGFQPQPGNSKGDKI